MALNAGRSPDAAGHSAAGEHGGRRARSRRPAAAQQRTQRSTRQHGERHQRPGADQRRGRSGATTRTRRPDVEQRPRWRPREPGQAAGRKRRRRRSSGRSRTSSTPGLQTTRAGATHASFRTTNSLTRCAPTQLRGARELRGCQQSANDLGAQGIIAQIAGQNAAMNQKNGEGVVSMLGNRPASSRSAREGRPRARGEGLPSRRGGP